MASFDSDFYYKGKNEEEYNKILAGYQQQADAFANVSGGINAGYLKMIEDNKSVGESDKFALKQNSERNLAKAQQSLMSRGLGNTNVLDSARRGINYDYANATTSLNDALSRRQTDLMGSYLGYATNQAGQTADIAQRKLSFQGNALSQRYGAAAGYDSALGLMDRQAAINETTQQRALDASRYAQAASIGAEMAGAKEIRDANARNINAGRASQVASGPAFAAQSGNYGNSVPPMPGGNPQNLVGGNQVIDYNPGGYGEGGAGVFSRPSFNAGWQEYGYPISNYGYEDYGLGELNDYLSGYGGSGDYGYSDYTGGYLGGE